MVLWRERLLFAPAEGCNGEMAHEGGDVCMHMAGWHCCAAETKITLQSNYTPIRKNS